MTPKEIFLELIKEDGHPERQLDQYEAFHMILDDPILKYLRGNIQRGKTSIDRWGTTILFPADAPGPVPHASKELRVLHDITHWRDVVKAPDLDANCSEGWEECAARARKEAGDEKLRTAFMFTGIFEQLHFLMGFEDTLANFYEHPDDMRDLIDYIFEYRMHYLELLMKGLQPEIVFTHDDWGAKDALFMKPEMWREFFKEPYRKFYGYIRDHGAIAIHHADSFLAPIVDDMAEIGIQVWQGALPENDIPALQAQLKGKLVLMGGIGADIDRPDVDEAYARSYIREALESYCPGGHYIPSITYGLAGTVYPIVDTYIDSEIAAYNSELHIPKVKLLPIPRRTASGHHRAQAVSTEAEIGSDTLKEIATALLRGKKKKLLSLCEKALGENIPVEKILSDGMMDGMTKLGDEFSQGRAFVPEMLIAARCMTEAMKLLKPYLVSDSTAQKGTAVIGSVKGDLHDIGKNLVRIMMEGNGLRVIDLGVDVSAEAFLETAEREGADIIACSSLLTTSAQEMDHLVKLVTEKDLRDKYCIMIGGASVSQHYADEIKADYYALDAGEAGRLASEIVAEKYKDAKTA